MDQYALYAYPRACQLYNKYYKSKHMIERFNAPLWKQAIETLKVCNWSLYAAKSSFKNLNNN